MTVNDYGINEHSLDKQRHVAMGLDHLGRILVVA